MIAVVAEPGPLRDALVSELGDEAAALDPGDPAALVRALGGLQRMVLAVGDPVAAGDAVAAAEMAHVYHCVSVWPVDALTGSSLRSTVLLEGPSAPFDAASLAVLAARAARSEPISD